MQKLPTFLALLLVTAVSAELEPRDRLIVETLIKLERFDVSGNSKWEGAVNRYAKAVRGTEEHLDIVQKFSVKAECPALLEDILAKPQGPRAANSTKLILTLGSAELLDKALSEADEKQSTALLGLLGFIKHKESARLLEAYLPNAKNAALRKKAANALLQVGDESQKEFARKQLGNSTNPEGIDAKVDIEALSKRKGDPIKGKAAYMKVCFACHKAGNIGIDYGPALTEIGSKLPKSELYLAIIDPNAGISFDYEGWTFQLSNGTSAAGIIQSEDQEEITLRMAGGLRQKLLKKDIKSREKMKTSLMPAGLHLALQEQELIDLIEFLASLKKT